MTSTSFIQKTVAMCAVVFLTQQTWAVAILKINSSHVAIDTAMELSLSPDDPYWTGAAPSAWTDSYCGSLFTGPGAGSHNGIIDAVAQLTPRDGVEPDAAGRMAGAFLIVADQIRGGAGAESPSGAGFVGTWEARVELHINIDFTVKRGDGELRLLADWKGRKDGAINFDVHLIDLSLGSVVSQSDQQGDYWGDVIGLANGHRYMLSFTDIVSTNQLGDPFSVFEIDFGDAAIRTPDSGATFVLFALSLLGVSVARRRFLRNDVEM